MLEVNIEDYMKRERLPLTFEINERRIYVNTPSTTFINVFFNEKTDISKLKSKYERYKTLAEGKDEHHKRLKRYADKVEQLQLWYDFAYERYEHDFHTLAFLWRAKVDSGIYMGCTDDLMLKNVLHPLHAQLEYHHAYGNTLHNAISLDMKLDDLIGKLTDPIEKWSDEVTS